MTFESKFRNVVGRIESLSKEEIIILFRMLLQEYNNEKKVNIDFWQGKSSFLINEVGDKIIVTKYQRPEKDAEPKEIKMEINKQELMNVERVVFQFFKYEPEKPFIKSTKIAEKVYNLSWKEIYCNRKRHNKFTIMLNVLDKKGIIKYFGGKIY